MNALLAFKMLFADNPKEQHASGLHLPDSGLNGKVMLKSAAGMQAGAVLGKGGSQIEAIRREHGNIIKIQQNQADLVNRSETQDILCESDELIVICSTRDKLKAVAKDTAIKLMEYQVRSARLYIKQVIFCVGSRFCSCTQYTHTHTSSLWGLLRDGRDCLYTQIKFCLLPNVACPNNLPHSPCPVTPTEPSVLQAESSSNRGSDTSSSGTASPGRLSFALLI